MIGDIFGDIAFLVCFGEDPCFGEGAICFGEDVDFFFRSGVPFNLSALLSILARGCFVVCFGELGLVFFGAGGKKVSKI